jgi:toxin ParE1/3/4
MKVRFNRGALNDIAEITAYIGERNPKAAADLLDRLESVARLIGRNPEIGPKTSRSNLRKFVVGNYLMIYEIAANEIIVHYVRHAARQRPWEDEA